VNRKAHIAADQASEALAEPPTEAGTDKSADAPQATEFDGSASEALAVTLRSGWCGLRPSGMGGVSLACTRASTFLALKTHCRKKRVRKDAQRACQCRFNATTYGGMSHGVIHISPQLG
jgi:hypothetical protein